MSDLEAVVRWYLVFALAGAAGLPVAAKLLGDAGRRAIWFARPVGLLTFFVPVWFLAAVVNLPFTRLILAASLLATALVGWHWFYHSGKWRALSLREVVAAEGVMLATFLGAIGLRGFTPEILNTEKPMDSAFLASIILTDRMPPPDPWLAGESINYYYLGYALHGSLAKLAGVASPVAFNLALASTTVMALAAAIGCALVIAPRQARLAAPLAAFLLIIAGNMDGPYRVLRDGRDAWNVGWWQGMGWNSSRVVYDGTIQTINEFPAFSIILGDLHPHLMALPFTIVALAVAVAIAREQRPIGWVELALAGALGGSLYALNSWDLPTYFGLIVLAALWNLRSLPLQQRAIRLGTMLATALVVWSPFLLTFTPFTAGNPDSLPAWLRDVPLAETVLTTLGVNRWEFTSAGEFLRVFGLPYALILTTLTVAGRGLDWRIESRDSGLVFGVPVALLVLFAILADAPVFVLVGVPAIIAVRLLLDRSIASTEGMVAALYLAGALIVGLTEIFYIDDQFHDRMNTLFKAYYQVWTLWGVAAAVGLAWLFSRAPRPSGRAVVSLAVAGSLVLGLVYPVTSAYRWTNEFDEWYGLDGLEYIVRFSEDELAGIAFVREHAGPNSVILEAPGCSYQPISRLPFNRVSAFTGVPTVIGWLGHEGQWRGGDDELRGTLGARRNEARDFFTSPTVEFLDRYNIEFVYYGIYEQGRGVDGCDWATALPAPDPAWMSDNGFEIVFQQGDVTIWQRIG